MNITIGTIIYTFFSLHVLQHSEFQDHSRSPLSTHLFITEHLKKLLGLEKNDD